MHGPAHQHGRLMIEQWLVVTVIAVALAVVIPRVPGLGWVVLALVVVGIAAAIALVVVTSRRAMRRARETLARVTIERGLAPEQVLESDVSDSGHLVGIDAAHRMLVFADRTSGGTLAFDAVTRVRADANTRFGQSTPSSYSVRFEAGKAPAPRLVGSRGEVEGWLATLSETFGERVERKMPD